MHILVGDFVGKKGRSILNAFWVERCTTTALGANEVFSFSKICFCVVAASRRRQRTR